LDDETLNRLWNEYWLATLSSSPLLSNKKEITNQILDITQKMEKPGKQAASNLGTGGDEMSMFEFGGTGRQKGRKAKGGGNVFSSGIGGFGGGVSKADGGDGKGISK